MLSRSHTQGAVDALMHLGLTKTAGEELRLKIQNRSFHGFEAAHKGESRRSAKKAGDGMDADALAQVFDTIETPVTPGSETQALNPLDRSPAWGAPSNLSGGDAGGRVSDLGQPSQSGGI